MVELIVFWMCCGIGAGIIASNRGESPGAAAFWGILLGPIGLLMALAGGKRCPHCQSKVHLKAAVCPKCQRELPAVERAEVSAAQPEPEENPSPPPPAPWTWRWTVGVVLVMILIIVLIAGHAVSK